MSLQPDLYGNELADKTLGENQRAVLEAWNDRGPLTDDEAGAVIHHRQRKHGLDHRCGWCSADGKQVVRSLRRRGLLPRPPRKPATGPPADRGEIPY